MRTKMEAYEVDYNPVKRINKRLSVDSEDNYLAPIPCDCGSNTVKIYEDIQKQNLTFVCNKCKRKTTSRLRVWDWNVL